MRPLHPTLISRSCRLGRFPFTPGNLGLHSSIWQSSPGLPDRDCCEGNQSALVYRKPAAAGSEVCLGRQPQATGHNPRHKRAGLLILGSGLLKLHSGSAIPSPYGVFSWTVTMAVFPGTLTGHLPVFSILQGYSVSTVGPL